MTWRLSERLIDLSRAVQGDRPSANVTNSATDDLTTYPELPENEVAAAIRSRQVFDLLAKPPLVEDGRAELDVSLVAEAMSMCGMNGPSCAAMYAVSQWAPTGPNGEASALDLDAFQFAVERFSAPARLQKRLRKDVEGYVTRRGLRFHHTVNDFMRTDIIVDCDLRRSDEQLNQTNNCKLTDRQQYWDAVLDELEASVFEKNSRII